MSAVALDRVTIALGATKILSGVSLEIGEGEFVGVLGPNGSGKTTLMRAILGLVRPEAGAIRVFGEPARRGDPAIGYLPQTSSAAGSLKLSGREFIAASVNGHRWGLPILAKAERHEIEACLALVGGGKLASRPLSEMSGGERQRLLIAEALVGRPRLLLLDEPLISLDPNQQRVVVDLVRRLSDKMRLTVLFSAHELNQLLGSIDRVLYLGQAHAALGTVDEVITPETLSRLYGAPIEVARVGGRIFVMSGGQDVESDSHRHDHVHL